MKKTKFLSLHLSTGSYEDFLERIVGLARKRTSSYVSVANVHMLVEAYRAEPFAQAVNQADLVTPDGMPLVMGLRWLYGIKQARVAGMDLLPDMLAQAENKGLKVFFYGSTEAILSGVMQTCQEKYPSCQIAGFYSPPFRMLSAAEEASIVQRINDSGAEVVFVALGCPKQEKWMAGMRSKIQAVMLGVGGAFPVFAGLQERAPIWMQRMSLEWVFRLYQEPQRLWKRYLLTNSLFIFLLLREAIQIKLLGRAKQPAGFEELA